MKPQKWVRDGRVIGVIVLAWMLGGVALAQPKPGDVFREYRWTNAGGDAGGSLRVGGKKGETNPGRGWATGYINDPVKLAQEFDLEHAVRAEAVIEKLLCHENTHGLAISVNGNEWIAIPEAAGIPAPQWEYQHHIYPVVAVPLEQLKAGGGNQFRLRVNPEYPNWPQNLIYGVHFRVYYDAAKKPHAAGRITNLKAGQAIGHLAPLEVIPTATAQIARVDFIGNYEDVNYEGDGNYRQWHYRYNRAELINHIGTAKQAPFKVNWNTTWVPDQDEPMQVAAWITDVSDVTFMTEAVGGLKLERPGLSVELCKPYEVPKQWVTRRGEFGEKFKVTGDLKRAVAAQVVFTSWSPGYLNGISINDKKIFDAEGPHYAFYFHRIPIADLSVLQAGENELKTAITPKKNGKMVHGTEINWPGIMVLIQYGGVKLTEDATDESAGGLACYKIETPAATYFLEKSGAGLSSMIDPEGIDWLGFHPREGSKAGGEFRGFPNAVNIQGQKGYFHPMNSGTGKAATKVEYAGSDRVTISAQSEDGRWGCRYDFLPARCTFTMTKIPAGEKYWVLYEGTPGGAYDDDDWWMTSDAAEPTSLTTPHEGDIPAPEWIAFGDPKSPRALLLVNHEDDGHIDRFYQMNKDMTVFGFGREGLKKFIDKTPQSFSIWFVESTGHEAIGRVAAQVTGGEYRKPAEVKPHGEATANADGAGNAKKAGGKKAGGKKAGGKKKAGRMAQTPPEGGTTNQGGWTYIEVDNERRSLKPTAKMPWLRCFGIAAADVTGDGMKDIVAGRYFYRNPGGDMSARWPRADFGIDVDGMLCVDADGDAFGDVIACQFPDVYWMEAQDGQGEKWNAKVICQLPKSSHGNGQGYMLGQVVAGGKPEIILSTDEGVFYIQIPDKPEAGDWPKTRMTTGTMDEGVGVGDVDGDGDLDIAVGREEGTPRQPGYKAWVYWFENPGNDAGDWKDTLVSATTWPPDRIAIADINGDKRNDIVVTEERYPGPDPDSNAYWFETPANPRKEAFATHKIVTQYSQNNLDVADMDGDGDQDIILAEHKGPDKKLQLWINDGRGGLTCREIGRGHENHLGARVADLDGDGDFDLMGIAWDEPQYLHVWRNDAKRRAEARTTNTEEGPVAWEHLSSMTGQIPVPALGRQVASLILDVDGDGVNDFMLASYEKMAWFRRGKAGWTRLMIENGDPSVRMEAGGAACDVDGDGDLDIIMGAQSKAGEIWWWENPAPDFTGEGGWKRHLVIEAGGTHHDQAIGDFDGDGKPELAFWFNKGGLLYLAEIPADPKSRWPHTVIWKGNPAERPEGLVAADVDRDGKVDIVGGGSWFKHVGGGKFEVHDIDATYRFTRTAAGDLVKGGRLEVLIGSGDGVGPLNLYEWRNDKWEKKTLIDNVDHGHTLAVADIDGDGNLDIYTGEMKNPGAGEGCRQWVLYGDGKGGFKAQLLSTGIGTHESKLGDLDGDGDVDILQKDFQVDQRCDVWLNGGIRK